NLSAVEKTELNKLLVMGGNGGKLNLEGMWYLMDLVWDNYACNNKKLNWNNITKFYSHPVWLLNGLFIEQDKVSMGHRRAISAWVLQNGFKKTVDYGGGFGTLARLIAEKDNKITVDVFEPHPSVFGLKRANQFDNINMIEKLGGNYDCLLSTDVLEHVDDPLNDFSKMIGGVKVGGYLLVANCFHPVIKCHLPQNFHFRFTFNIFARLMGLKVKGVLEGSHATIFQKNIEKKVNWKLIRALEVVSKAFFPFISILLPVLRPIKRVIAK
ncbi:MAG: methyltransferase domain-containing protein, partial [Cycloclasticus sp.]|nr:methyltransferase domain-containing protein [Cycloclasticus sp.]